MVLSFVPGGVEVVDVVEVVVVGVWSGCGCAGCVEVGDEGVGVVAVSRVSGGFVFGVEPPEDVGEAGGCAEAPEAAGEESPFAVVLFPVRLFLVEVGESLWRVIRVGGQIVPSGIWSAWC